MKVQWKRREGGSGPQPLRGDGQERGTSPGQPSRLLLAIEGGVVGEIAVEYSGAGDFVVEDVVVAKFELKTS